MRVVIIGCGRIGAGLAHSLSLRGDTLAVVDQDPVAFQRLGAWFKGETVVGVGFDRDMLLRAGIQRADGLAAVVSSDEANVVIARTAREVFRVPSVVACVYDPAKAEIYRRLGLQTISPVTLGTNRLAELLTFSPLDTIVSLGNGDVDIVGAEISPLLVGRTVDELTILGEVHVVAISRGGKTFLPTLGTKFQHGDLIHLAVSAASASRLKALLGVG